MGDTIEEDPIEIDELGPYLEDHVRDFDGLERVVRFSAGHTNPTYRLDAASGTYVLRTRANWARQADGGGDASIAREYRIMKALGGSDVPVPAMHYLAEGAGTPLGKGFLVMDHVAGRHFDDPVLPAIETTGERGRIYEGMNDALVALHRIDVDGLDLPDLRRPTQFFRREIETWSNRYRQAKTDDLEDMETLIAWLEENQPPDDGETCLLHGDFRLDRMLFRDGDGTVAALLDWELSALGHPLCDLALQCVKWRLPHVGAMKGLGDNDRGELGIPTEAQYVARYCDGRGIDRPEHWTFHLAFSFLKLAALLQASFRRYCDGDAIDPQGAKAYGTNVPKLAEQGVALTREGA